jgi:small subunit ribosomal protein S15
VKKYQNSFNDHGSAGVQCASMSERVILLMMHMKKYPKDTKAGRYLTRLLDQRRHMLNYLMRTDYHKYDWVCTDYGIPKVHPRNAHHVRNQGLYENTYRVIF